MRARKSVAALLLAGGLIAGGAGVVTLGTDGSVAATASAVQTLSAAPAPSATAAPIPKPTATEPPQVKPFSKATRPAVVNPAPVQLDPASFSVDGIGMRYAIPYESHGLTADGSSLVIAEPHRATLYSGGAQIGDKQGTVLLAGHVNDRSGAPTGLWNLSTVRAGAIISVKDESGVVHRYYVESAQEITQGKLPADLFSKSGPARLALVTCGDLVGGVWTTNVVVIARPI